jgi:RNA polymerase-binding protein DksA
MEKIFVDTMRESLLSLKEQIIDTLISENADFKDLVEDMDPKDLADIAADDIDRKTLETLSAQEIRRLRKIDSALSRMENGRYGVCARCNKKIPKKRLEAIPYAVMCIECKSSDERKNR